MGKKGNYGLLLAMLEPGEGMWEEFNDWYDTEHIPERSGVPGFLEISRFIVCEGYPKSLALYDLESPQVLESEAYKSIALSGYSPWSKRIISRSPVFVRNTYEQVYPGQSLLAKNSNALTLWAYDVDKNKEEEFNRWVEKEFINKLRDIPQFINLRRFHCIEGSPQWLLLIEFKDIEAFNTEEYQKLFQHEISQLVKESVKKSILNTYQRYQRKQADPSFEFKAEGHGDIG
ncbi:MAG: hypothetical protein K9J85_01060 [Desulfobacteraceae bacterium]|nr:hypothetical protein [Desulfobacteraceae bacterium]